MLPTALELWLCRTFCIVGLCQVRVTVRCGRSREAGSDEMGGPPIVDNSGSYVSIVIVCLNLAAIFAQSRLIDLGLLIDVDGS